MLQEGIQDIKNIHSVGSYDTNEYGQVKVPSWQETNYLTTPEIKNVSEITSTPTSENIKIPASLPNNPFLNWFGIKEPIASLSADKVAQIKAAMGVNGVGNLWFSPNWMSSIENSLKRIIPTKPQQNIASAHAASSPISIFKNIVDANATKAGSWLNHPIAKVNLEDIKRPSSNLQTIKSEDHFTYENIKKTIGMSGLGSTSDWSTAATAIGTGIESIFGKSNTSTPAPQTVVVSQPIPSSSNMTTYLLIGGGVLAGVAVLALVIKK